MKEANESKQEELKNIEFEQVTIKLPKNVMDLLRDYSKHGLKMTPEEYLEFSAMQTVRADLDMGDVFTVEAEEIVRQYDLNPALSVVP